MRKPGEVLSHWRTFSPNFNMSSQEFYANVRKALEARKYPAISIEEVSYSEGGLHTAKRAYLRVRRENLVFDICAAPFGVDFLFSWWLAELAPTFAILWGCASVIAVPIVLAVAVNYLGFWKGLFIGSAAVAFVMWFIGNLAPRNGLYLELLEGSPRRKRA